MLRCRFCQREKGAVAVEAAFVSMLLMAKVLDKTTAEYAARHGVAQNFQQWKELCTRTVRLVE